MMTNPSSMMSVKKYSDYRAVLYVLTKINQQKIEMYYNRKNHSIKELKEILNHNINDKREIWLSHQDKVILNNFINIFQNVKIGLLLLKLDLITSLSISII